MIDLKANPPAVIATLQAGAGVTGVSINPAGTLAITANRSEGTLSVFTISGKTLTPAGKIDLGNKASGPSHVAFLPDGKSAIVTRDGDHRVSILSIDGTKVEDTKKFMVGGFRPYSLVVSPKGDVAVFGNQGGGQGDSDQINVVDLKSNPPRVVEAITVGQTPEGVSMAPDGSHVAVILHNGSPRNKNHPAYNDHGLMRIFKVDGTKLTLVTTHQDRHLGAGLGVEQRRQDHRGAGDAREGAAGVRLRRQGSQADRRRSRPMAAASACAPRSSDIGAFRCRISTGAAHGRARVVWGRPSCFACGAPR